jgi:arylformamidase
MPRHDDPLWLEAQYDNRARVADSPQRIAAWTQASQAARAGSPGARLDLRYAPGPGGTLDVFPGGPAATGPDGAPVLLFIHGGYWRALAKEDFSFLAPAFNAAGAAVVVPDYALCPKVSIEHIALQMVQAHRRGRPLRGRAPGGHADGLPLARCRSGTAGAAPGRCAGHLGAV